MKRATVALVLASLALLSFASAQETPAGPPNWRKLRSTAAFLGKFWNREARRYDLQALPLLQAFADSAKVTIRYDEPTMLRVAPVALAVGEGAEPPSQFDLVQLALAPRYALLPESGERAFGVFAAADIPARAPRVEEAQLDLLCANEWALAALALEGRDPRAVEKALQTLKSISGRIEIVNDGRSLLVLDIGANLRRMKALIPELDRPRQPVDLVPYSRGAHSDVARLVPHLRGVLVLLARNAGIAPESVYLAHDSETGVVSGMIPRALAGTLDAAIEAADNQRARAEAAAAADPKRFVQFTLSAPVNTDGPRFAARLRIFFEAEANLADARFLAQDEKSPLVHVRCRPWLEADIREAAGLMGG
jgi:hypothetical protein